MTFLDTKSNRTVRLKSVTIEKNTDYYLGVKSHSKEKKEEGMKLQFEKRFEGGTAKDTCHAQNKGGLKKLEKVYQRKSRASKKYPTVQHYYDINVDSEAIKGLAKEIIWKKEPEKNLEKTENLGIYFLQTNMKVREEYVVRNIYNTIRKIENAFLDPENRSGPASDLSQKLRCDDSAPSSGTVAYWLVNTVRYQLKNIGIKSCWGEIVRIGNTQKVITTSGTNTYDKTVTTRKCNEPEDNLKRIYDIHQTKNQPFTKRKSVAHKLEIKKTKTFEKQLLMMG